MAELLKGAPVARALTEELAVRCAALRERGVVPMLAIVRVGEREDDLSYERGALKRCEKVGIESRRCFAGRAVDGHRGHQYRFGCPWLFDVSPAARRP